MATVNNTNKKRYNLSLWRFYRQVSSILQHFPNEENHFFRFCRFVFPVLALGLYQTGDTVDEANLLISPGCWC